MSEELEKFQFDEAFQTTIVALLCRDPDFHIRTDGLIKPEYFANELEAGIASCYLDHFQKYRTIPRGKGPVTEMIKDGILKRKFRKGLVHDIPATLQLLSEVVIKDKDFVIDKVAEFARHQALKKAILDSVELIEKGKFDDVETAVKRASEVGVVETDEGYSYFETVQERKTYREELLSGKIAKSGITTGLEILDTILYHGGWGRKELSIFMGGPKSGKTMALLDSARAACFAGHNVLYVTLEVSAKIIAERLDANIAEIGLNALGMNAEEVAARVEAAKAGCGLLRIHEFPTGSLTAKALTRLLHHYKAKGTVFDLVIVDYADLMAPDHRSSDTIDNSKQIYVGLRAIAQMENVALLSATQTNREGFQQAVQRMEHVSDDINKARIVDLLISINAMEDEKARQEARLYFAASRNQEDGVTIRVKQALERGKFIARVLGKE
jgi:replicative DNA helicase